MTDPAPAPEKLEPAPPIQQLSTGSTLLILLAAGVFGMHVFRYRGYLLDDAYISLRYADHLAAGHGLVWNVTSVRLGEPVEGYTNFLWVLLGALFLKLGTPAMAALQAVSAVAALGTLALTARLARLTRGAGTPVVPAVVWLLAAEGAGYYATTGMESMLFTCLFAAAMVLGLGEARIGRRRGAVAVFILLTLTRPEGVLLFGLGQAAFALAERRRRGVWGIRRRAADVLIYAAAIGTWIAWRVAYYGELLPNTYHAKVTGGAEQLAGGLLYLGDWALAHPVFALALGLPAVLLARRPWRARLATPELPAVWALALAWVGYVVAVGGDSMPFHRFLLPILPPLAVLASASLAAAAELWPHLGRGRRPAALAVLLLAVQLVAGRFGDEPMRAFVAHRTTLVGLETGRHLAAARDPADLLAVNTAGALPWASGLPSLDMLGLTEPAIARHDVYVVSPRWSGHRRGWGRHVLSRRPAVVVWYNSAGAREPHYLGDHQLADNPFFRFFYQLRRAELPATDEGHAVARFLGTPFGTGEGGRMVSPNLGLRFEIRPGLLGGRPSFEDGLPERRGWAKEPNRRLRVFGATVAYDAPIVFHYFELRRVHEALWPLRDAAGGDLDRFLDAAVRRWRAGARPSDPQARREVERLCDQALAHVRAGRTEAAQQLLSRAAERNAAARSPLVGQYVANLAVAEKNLFLAVQAQLEALRLDPDNALYRANLKRLLTVPYEEFTAGG